MKEITLKKLLGSYLTGSTLQDCEAITKIKDGEGIKFTRVNKRCLWMHRKYFALLNLGYEAWEPEEVEHNGMPAQKNFDKFRKDIEIAAGYYELTINLKGEARAEAKSISFARMKEDEFDALYYATIDVLIKYVLKNYTKEDADHVVGELLKFN